MSGGGSMTMFGRKGAKRSSLGLTTGNSTNTKVAGVQSQPTVLTTAYGSSTGHLTVGQNDAQNLPLQVRVFTSGTGDPASWSVAGEVAQFATQSPTTAFLWTWKGNKTVITANPALLSASTTPTLAQYNAMRSKWIAIWRDQTPDVRKDGGVLDTVGWWHEPFKASGNDVEPGPWAQAQINVAEWVRQANIGRANKLAVCGVMNGHDQAFPHFGEFFPPALRAVTNPQIILGFDCYNWVGQPNHQITQAHTWVGANAPGHPWNVPELGWIIDSDARRPTDAQALAMAQTVHNDVVGWTAASRPTSILWFNNGGQPFDGINNLLHPENNVPLPNTLNFWKGLNP